MKRGQLPFESLIGIILRVLGVVVLVAVLFLLVRPLLFPEKSAEEQDFDRVIRDFEDLMQQQYQGSDITLRVPVTTVPQIVAFAAGSGPCGGVACVCLYEQGKPKTCKKYADLKQCTSSCGKVSCVRSGVAAVAGGTVTITRGCSNVGFVGIQV